MSETVSTTIAHAEACACPACVGFNPDTVVILGDNVDGTGGTLSGKPVYTLDQIVANLNRTSYTGTTIPGPQWNFGEDFMGQNKSGDPKIIQYDFYETRAEMFQVPYVYPNAAGTGLAGRSEYFGFAPFSAAQREATELAIQLWDDLIDVSFVKVDNINQADITYGNLTNAPGTQAYAYLPYNYGGNSAGLQGDVWVSLSQASNLQLGLGDYGYKSLVHETGHAIGLQHPGAYNAAPGVSITYGPNAEYYQDTRMYSTMSYFNAEFSGGAHIDWNQLYWVFGQTPLLHDIAAVQAMYGADLTTRTGDTVYGFNSNTGMDVYDFGINDMPVISIYDAGGNDTLDFSGWNSNSLINLNPGAFSDGGGSGIVPLETLKANGLLPESYTEDQYAALRARYNSPDGMLHDNISIAYGTTIENAVGGGGNDTIIGNSVANILSGGAGNDSLLGGDGVDSLIGGLGNDIFIGEINATKVDSKNGPISLDRILDFAAGDILDLSGIDANTGIAGDQAFTFVGHANPTGAGEVGIRTFGNMNAAEKALGMDLDGLEGPSSFGGKVTVVFGNVDGGEPDFAMVMMNSPALTSSDFIF